jgi:hypothetical protein
VAAAGSHGASQCQHNMMRTGKAVQPALPATNVVCNSQFAACC